MDRIRDVDKWRRTTFIFYRRAISFHCWKICNMEYYRSWKE